MEREEGSGDREGRGEEGRGGEGPAYTGSEWKSLRTKAESGSLFPLCGHRGQRQGSHASTQGRRQRGGRERSCRLDAPDCHTLRHKERLSHASCCSRLPSCLACVRGAGPGLCWEILSEGERGDEGGRRRSRAMTVDRRREEAR